MVTRTLLQACGAVGPAVITTNRRALMLPPCLHTIAHMCSIIGMSRLLRLSSPLFLLLYAVAAAVFDLQYVAIAKHPFVALSNDLSAKRRNEQHVHAHGSKYVVASAGSCVNM